MHIPSDPPARVTPPPMFGARAADAGGSGFTRHRRPKSVCSYPGTSRPGEIDPLGDDTIELELTPDQIRTLEEAAKLAFARRSKLLQPATRVTPTSAHQVNASPAVAPFSAKVPGGAPGRRSSSAQTAIIMPPVGRATAARTTTTVVPANNAGVIPLPVCGSAQRGVLQSVAKSATPSVSEVKPTEAPRRQLAPSHLSTTTTAPWRARQRLLVLAISISLLVIAAAAVIHFSALRAVTPPKRESPSTFEPPPSQPELASTTRRPPLPPESTSSLERLSLPPATGTQVPPPGMDVAEPVTATPPVKYVNPFDRSEVFEFPPGTTRAEARDAVAQILMERARDRWRPIKRAGETRD
jgi:hypothetical protein